MNFFGARHGIEYEVASKVGQLSTVVVRHQPKLHGIIHVFPRNTLLRIRAADDRFIQRQQRNDVHRVEVDVGINKHEMGVCAAKEFVYQIIPRPCDKGFVEQKRKLDLDVISRTDARQIQNALGIRTKTLPTIHGGGNKDGFVL